MDAYLALEDGLVVEGRGRVSGQQHGELVFTTAYTGYEESLTDPSYAEQVLTFAYPLIGNYGVRAERFESDSIHPSAVIARQLTEGVVDWLREESVPALDSLDSRFLVRKIRDEGAMRCGLVVGETVTPDDALAELGRCAPMSDHTDIGAMVSVDKPIEHGPETDKTCEVALIDCGVKRSMIDSLVSRGARVHQLPHDAQPSIVDAIDPDLVFLSNGPGDPEVFDCAEELVTEFAGERPVAGICLGQQIVANALGGETEKLPFGHRGVNQPVFDLESGQTFVTTQNHGYNVGDPGPLDVTQINLNDRTAEGLSNPDLGIITRQYHPEAHPGPHDTVTFFDEVITLGRQSIPSIAD